MRSPLLLQRRACSLYHLGTLRGRSRSKLPDYWSDPLPAVEPDSDQQTRGGSAMRPLRAKRSCRKTCQEEIVLESVRNHVVMEKNLASGDREGRKGGEVRVRA